MAVEHLAPRRGRLISLEGVWGAGKTTNARRLATRLAEQGFRATVLHDPDRDGFIGELTRLLDRAPLRRRDGDGGFDRPHHATVDVLLRLGREAHHHLHQYLPALASHDVVILDRGLYAKLAYALTVLAEHHPAVDRDTHHDRWWAITSPWWVVPDLAIFLDQPWTQARDRAVRRTRARGVAHPKSGSHERELFLPHYDANMRWVAARHPAIATVPVDRGPDAVFADIAALADALLAIPRTGDNS